MGIIIPPLQFAPILPVVWDALGALQRSGWVIRGVKDPETVQEHTLALLQIAATIYEELNREERRGLFEMLEVHDFPEWKHGDEIVASNNPKEEAKQREAKFIREEAALREAVAPLGAHGAVVMNLWHRFERSSDPAAQLARQLDKFQAIEKAWEYETSQGIRLFEEFYKHGERNITHPILVQSLSRLGTR